jgi:hypothetical protein
MNKYPELHDAVTNAKTEMFNPRVERALAERAIGYSVDVEELFVIDGEIVRETVRKHYPPDVTACIYWTKNREPEKWRDVQRHEIDNKIRSSEDIRLQLVAEFKDLIDQGLLTASATSDEDDQRQR